ncbi:acyltransferase domain-containing protein [Streptomyces cocklensis]|uniref:type I polyketide synthase n=1 Tax=Actinacidiphila cocklensis TaxID=887465 RepID=UPI002041D3F5|nr:type I polyketide synthase [Actinacidiphila cocklensis]MDD1059816.1 acyltransferase domain-containing protein [Actinacidiphila cocklensis]WSX72682.1 type I polyketide synthase [Streptomyces sp. NBC_00899]WSX81250.1 type I polyketide synthase [Streptomyces sp. NBC_00899]
MPQPQPQLDAQQDGDREVDQEGDRDLDRIAIVGMAGRFPGAGDVDTFWTNLEQGKDGITSFTDEELAAAGTDPELLARDGYVKAKGVLEGADLFDGSFFGYSHREAELLDPQHRVFLECAWHALESAGVDPAGFEGRIGVFAGAGLNTYLLFNLMNNQRVVESAGMYQVALASDKDFLATRAAYKLGLTGPAVTVQSACSTSLTAVHLACQSLANGECDIALAGGVAVTSPLRGGYQYEPGGILSPDGTCRAFDADAAGTVAGNGVGVVVLRRLADARADGDGVDAVILATAVNNDGSLKAGYTAPSVDGQADVIAEALALADIAPATVGYVETHGTGTPLGDPIEIAALTRAFRSGTDDQGFCAIGSVKSNVGHLDAAAGVTGLIKAALALKHEAIPPTLHCDRPNPGLELDTSPFYVNTELRAWPRKDEPRRAGVSSFGIGGTNVHVVLEEAPAQSPVGSAEDPAAGPAALLLPLSAKSAPALAEAAARLADHLEADPGTPLEAVAHTLARRRARFPHRGIAVARTAEEAVTALRRLATDVPAAPAPDSAPVAFLFPGQGAQYPGMARGLYESEPVFAAEFDRCAGLFAPHLGEDLRPLVLGPPDTQDTESSADRLRQTRIAQPALFAVEYALAKLWQSWGVRPRAMAGHSVGEYTAACLAGVFSLEDAIRLVAVRGRLVQQMPAGAMLSVFLPEQETAALLGDGLALAAVNSTSLTVVAGTAAAVDALEQRLKGDGVGCRRLHTSHGFHSPAMDAAVAPFTDEVRSTALNPPSVPFLSNVTGTWITAEQATSPDYWGTHLRQPVRFRDALGVLLADPGLVPLEVGPGRNLTDFARAHGAWTPGRAAAASLRHPGDHTPDDALLQAALGTVWSAGAFVDWAAVQGTDRHRAVQLPGYPFQRRRYWVEPAEAPRTAARTTGPDGWFYAPGWQRLTLPARRAAEATGDVWVVLGAGLALGDTLADRLAATGDRVVRVTAGAEPARTGDDIWTLDPAARDDLSALVSALAAPPAEAVDGWRLRFVHLWSTAEEPSDGPLTGERLDAARRTGFDSLLALAQALGTARPPVPVTLDVLCRGVYDVTGDEPLAPEHALLLGAAAVIPQETADTACRVLDIAGTDPRAPHDTAVHALLTALTGAGDEPELALRGRHWWRRTFEPTPLADGGTGLRDGGVYLITGGLGGLGLAMAEHIAAAVAQPVLGLLGRSAFPPPDEWDGWLAAYGADDATSVRIRRLRQMADLGARVVLLQADVTDVQQMRQAVGDLRAAADGPVNGVVHAAGLPSQGMIVTRSPAGTGTVLAAKTRGLLVLDQVCAEDDLEFLLLCSSVTAVLGGPGQSDYAAANAFLDAWAQAKRRESGLPVTAVGWDTWQETGMAAGLGARLGIGTGTPLTGHPLLQRLVRSTPVSRTYASVFSTDTSWIVGDHRIQGHGLVPGTAYLELVRAAVAEQAAGRDIEIGEVQYTVPVVVPDGQTREVFTTVEERDGRWHFAVQSRTGTPGAAVWTDHARGTVAFPEPEPDTVRDLDALLAGVGVTEVLDTGEAIRRGLRLDRFEKGGPIEFSFGPRWKCMREIQVGPRRVLATLRLDEEYHGDLDHYLLHPSLLDAAGGTARVHVTDTYYLPFSYRSLRFRHGLTSTVHAYVELKAPEDSAGETSTCDIEILDPGGRVLVQIADFTIKRINDTEGLRDRIARAAEQPAPGPGEDGGAGAVALRTLAEGITEQQGKDVFAQLLAAADLPGHVVVSHRDFGGVRALARSLNPALLAQEMDQLAPPGATHPRPDLPTPFVAPRTPGEEAVAEIWRDILGVDRVGVDDDFFALGGHSLAAVQIGTRLKASLGAELDLRAFFDHPTVARTAELLDSAGTGVPRAASGDAIEVLSREAGEESEFGAGDFAAAAGDPLAELSDEEVEAQLLELLAAEAADAAEGENKA